MKKRAKAIGYLLAGFLFFWAALTLWANYSGKQQTFTIGNAAARRNALILYNADPFYNLDEQVCRRVAEGLSHHDFSSKIATINQAHDDRKPYDLYVFCANTYNWAPDWPTAKFIRTHEGLAGKNVVALTLGAGSTQWSKDKLEELLRSKKANILASKSYWLLRPNDEKRSEENIQVATDMAKALGDSLGRILN